MSSPGEDRARILVVSRNLPPLTGGMERLNHHLLQHLSRSFECTVIGPPGSSRLLGDTLVCEECRSGSANGFVSHSFLRAVRFGLAERGRLALSVATSGLTAPAALAAARLAGARAVVFAHGLDLVAESRAYRRLFLPAVRRADRLIANSANTARLALAIGVEPRRISIINPGVELPAPHRGSGFRTRFGLTGKRVLLSVGRLVRRKGLAEFIDRCLPRLVARDPDLMLVIVGGEAADAIRRDASVTAAIEAAVERQRLGRHVRLCGRLADAELSQAYAESDVFVFPLVAVAGDVEGFGMVAIEAAAHGLPTVAFDEGGVSDAVEPEVSGWLVAPGDYDAFAARVVQVLDLPRTDAAREACRSFAARFSWPRYGEAAVQALRETAVGVPASRPDR